MSAGAILLHFGRGVSDSRSEVTCPYELQEESHLIGHPLKQLRFLSCVPDRWTLKDFLDCLPRRLILVT